MNDETATGQPLSLDELDLDSLRLGEDAREIRLSTREDNRRVAAALALQATRTLELFSHDLEPELYDQPDFLEAVRLLALRSPRVRIRILLQDAGRAVRDGHRLVELMRRLSSFIEIRQPHHDYQDHPEAFLIVDGTGLLHRRMADRYEGLAGFRMPLRARELGNLFDEIWQRSEPHPDLRRLHI